MGFWRFDWWRDENNREGASSLAGVLKIAIPAIVVTVVAVGGWFGWIKPAPQKPAAPTIQTGDDSPVQTGSGTQITQGDQGTVIIGMSIDQHEAILARRQKELRADLTRASTAEKALIQQELGAVQTAMANLETSYQTALEDLRLLRQKLGEFSGQVPSDRLEAAQTALFEGDRTLADQLLAEIEDDSEDAIKIAAEAAYTRGEIAEQEIRWHDAAAHYTRAARLNSNFDYSYKAMKFSWRAGDFTTAYHLSEDAIRAATTDNNQVQLARFLNGQAVILNEQAKYEESEILLRQVLEIDRKTIGEDHPDFAEHLGNLANAVKKQGRYNEAENLLRKVLEIDRASFGDLHSDYAITLVNLGGAISAQGRLEEAERMYREALEIDRETIGEMHPDYAIHLNNLGLVVAGQGRFEEAEALYRQALAVDKATIGDGHPDYAIALNNHADLLEQQGKLAEAEDLYRRALEIDRETIGEDHPGFAIRLSNLAGVLVSLGRYDDAETLYLEALEIAADAIGPQHPHYAIHLNNYANLVNDLGRLDEAEDLYSRALEITEQALGPDHPNFLALSENLDSLLVKKNGGEN